METENTINDLRVASFSYYLKPIDQGAVNMFDASETFTDIFTATTPHLRSKTRTYSKSSSGKRWFRGYTTPCSTKKSVYVQQSIKKVQDQFTFPVLINPTMEIFTNNKEKVLEVPRMSIEVFGSGTITKGDIEKTIIRKMSILSWDAIPTTEESVVCDDMASEASSDLFEIENVLRSGWQPSESTQYTKKKRDNGLLGCNRFKSVKVVEPVVYRRTDKSNIRYI